MSELEGLAGLVVAVLAILGYIAGLLRKVRKSMKRWEQLAIEHRVLYDVGHYHDRAGRPVLVARPRIGPRHRQGEPWS